MTRVGKGESGGLGGLEYVVLRNGNENEVVTSKDISPKTYHEHLTRNMTSAFHQSDTPIPFFNKHIF